MLRPKKRDLFSFRQLVVPQMCHLLNENCLDEIPKAATGKLQRIGLAEKLGLVG